MADFLANGRVLQTTDGTPFTITALYEKRNRFEIYNISIGGEDKIFTRFIDCEDEKKSFYEKLASKKIATAETNWPVAFCNNPLENIYGFISNAMPKDYTTLSDLLYKRTSLFSLKTEIDICLNLASLFGKLCEKGYYVSNITESDIAFNTTNGAVFLNVFSGITNQQTIRPSSSIKFIPPEYYHQNGKNILPESARYILAVIMFIIFFRAHPIEGAKAHSKAYLSKEELYNLYLKAPVFMLDPNDDSNRPSEYIYSKLSEKWNSFPEFIKDLFIQSFAKDTIKDPLARPDELKWINELVRMRSFSFACTCSSILTLSEEGKGTCSNCKKAFEVACKIQLKNYTIPAINKTRIYRCQVTDDYTTANATQPVGVIVANPSNPQLLGFKNMTGETLVCTTSDGNQKLIAHSETAPIISGVSVEIYGTTVHFINSLSVPVQPVQKTVVEPEKATVQEDEFVFDSEEPPAEPTPETAQDHDGESQDDVPVQTLSEEPLPKENAAAKFISKPIKPENAVASKERQESSRDELQPIAEPETQEDSTEQPDSTDGDGEDE